MYSKKKKKEALLYLHDSLYFLKDENMLLCKMSGHSLKTKIPGAEFAVSSSKFHLNIKVFALSFSLYSDDAYFLASCVLLFFSFSAFLSHPDTAVLRCSSRRSRR